MGNPRKTEDKFTRKTCESKIRHAEPGRPVPGREERNMASLRLEAQYILSDARDEIAWIACWHEGRGWRCEAFWIDYDEKTGQFSADEIDAEALREIVARDPHAILVNGYYYNLGEACCMTRDSLASRLRYYYDCRSCLVVDALGEGA